MHSLWLFFLKKRSFTYMVMFFLVVTGMYSLVAIPKESSPEVIIPVGIVSTVLRGAGAEDTEKLITDKVEEEIINLENIDKVTSSSREGISIVTAQFTANANIEKSIQDLKDAVDKAKVNFPSDANEPTVTKVNFSDQPILIISISDDRSPAALTALGNDLKKEIKKINGVSKVEVAGTRAREVQVVVSKEKLTEYNISLNQVIQAVGSSNTSLPVGNITVSQINYPIKFSGEITTANELADVAVTTINGVPVYLRDIAFIADGLEVPSTYSRVSEHGDPSEQALTLNIYKKSGGDVTKIARDVKKQIEELQKTTLLNAQVVISFDRGSLVERDLKELTRVGLETVTLVMIMLFLTIGWRESIVAGLSIPLSFVIAFIGLYISGNSINFVSLFSLILAIGILVDSGIVVAEAIHTRRKMLGNSYDAAILSIKEYAWPLIAGTMTTVAVFVPLFFISGTTGKFIASIPFTIIFVLIASIFVALGMVPLLAILLTKDHKNRFEDLQEEWSEKAKRWYKNMLARILHSRRAQNIFFVALGVGFVVAITLPILGLVKVQFFPQDNQDFIFVSVEKPEGTPLRETDLAVREVEEMLYTSDYVDSFVTTIGASSAFSNSGSSRNTKLASITVLLKKDRVLTSTQIVEKFRTEFSPITTATVRVDQGNNGPPSGAPVVIKFLGNDLGALSIASQKAEAVLTTIPGTQDVESSLRDDGTQFTIRINRAKAALVGLSPLSVAQLLRTSVSGTTATTIKDNTDDIDVVVKLNLNNEYINPEDTIKANIDSIKQLPVATPLGTTVLLGSIIDVALSQSRAVIAHEDKERIATVSSNLRPKYTAVEIVNEFKKHEQELTLPAGVTIDYGGENEEVNRSFRDMFLALIAGMVGMLAILVLEFNSIRFAVYLLFAVPLSLIGVLGGLALTGQTLSFSSMLGFIALAGVIINHAIILLDSILHRLHKEKEQVIPAKLDQIIVESSAIRLRPIFLTTVTTVIGMVPLAGASALWGPLAFAIMFGLTFAMILTLVLVPVLFYRFPGVYKDMK
jgi:HAE1 family hydrophobic/amphiphilic exporter-1